MVSSAQRSVQHILWRFMIAPLKGEKKKASMDGWSQCKSLLKSEHASQTPAGWPENWHVSGALDAALCTPAPTQQLAPAGYQTRHPMRKTMITHPRFYSEKSVEVANSQILLLRAVQDRRQCPRNPSAQAMIRQRKQRQRKRGLFACVIRCVKAITIVVNRHHER